MSAVLMIVLVLAGLLLLAGLAGIAVYNGFVRARVRTDEAWSAIDVQLKRRSDLVPNLVETVKGYATHERATLENVADRVYGTALLFAARAGNMPGAPRTATFSLRFVLPHRD